jgi:hypothetical protein
MTTPAKGGEVTETVNVPVRSLAVLLAWVARLYLRLGAAPPRIEKDSLKADADGLMGAWAACMESIPEAECQAVTAARHKVEEELWGTESPQYKGGLMLRKLFPWNEGREP